MRQESLAALLANDFVGAAAGARNLAMLRIVGPSEIDVAVRPRRVTILADEQVPHARPDLCSDATAHSPRSSLCLICTLAGNGGN